MILRTQHNILKFLLEDIEKWVNFEVIVGLWDVVFAHRVEPFILHTLLCFWRFFWFGGAVHASKFISKSMFLRSDDFGMILWWFGASFWRIFGTFWASNRLQNRFRNWTSTMEAQWGLQDGHWGRQVAAGGPPKVKEPGHFALGIPFWGSLHVLWTIHKASQPGRPMTSRGWRILYY